MAITEITGEMESARAALELNPLDEAAAGALRKLAGIPSALSDSLAALNGGAPSREPSAGAVLSKAEHERLVIHPREKQERRHKLASVLSRVVVMVQGDNLGRTIASVTEEANAEEYPRLFNALHDTCRTLEVEHPSAHIARGREAIFTILLNGPPFLCVHREYIEGESAFSNSALRFGLGHQMEHVKNGHAALLQLSPERLEEMILQEVPFLFRTPLILATKALGISRVNRAAKKVGDWLPDDSRSAKVFEAVGDLLPDKDQETVLPEVVHDWVRSWLQGVEYSADRAGLVCSGSVFHSLYAMLRMSPALSPAAAELKSIGMRRILQESGNADRITADRIRELLRFAYSRDWLGRVKV